MDKELKAKWVAALRSGEYLGVLHDIGGRSSDLNPIEFAGVLAFNDISARSHNEMADYVEVNL